MDRDYKIERSTEHRAKFRADQPTELGDYAAKKKKKLEIWAKPNVSPPSALSPIGRNWRGGNALSVVRGASVKCQSFLGLHPLTPKL